MGRRAEMIESNYGFGLPVEPSDVGSQLRQWADAHPDHELAETCYEAAMQLAHHAQANADRAISHTILMERREERERLYCLLGLSGPGNRLSDAKGY